jgi:dihydropteroate synthase
VVQDVISVLQNKLFDLEKRGVGDVIIDPGFGFAKTVEQNFELFSNLQAFQILERPILVGLSRKSMIWRTLKVNPEDALNGTTALNSIALLKGADILRVHDVKETKEIIQLFKFINN